MNEHLRLQKLRKALNLSQGQLAKAIGRKQGSISDIERGRNSVEGIAQLLKLTFRANPAWLRNGEGEMFLSKSYEQPTEGKSGVPYYDIRLSGPENNFPEVAEPPGYYVDFKPFNDCTAYLPYYGDSMYPKYLNGDIIAVKQLTNLDVILWGEAYLVIANGEANNLKAVRLLLEHKNKAKVILRAVNPAFKGDIVLDKSSIVSLHLVKGKITVMA